MLSKTLNHTGMMILSYARVDRWIGKQPCGVYHSRRGSRPSFINGTKDFGVWHGRKILERLFGLSPLLPLGFERKFISATGPVWRDRALVKLSTSYRLHALDNCAPTMRPPGI